jgi:selenocysteine lyase/cysteine desulfurase
VAVKRKALPKSVSFLTGGGTARLMATDWVVWEKAPDRFEAGTPSIINIIAFAKALRLIMKSDKNIFMDSASEKLTAAEILYHDELENLTGHELLAELRKTLIGRDIQVPPLKGPDL